MIRRHVLSALAAGVAAGDDDAARAAIGTIDWVLRGAARRHLERALIDAALATREVGGATDPEATRHVQRVAALAIARIEVEVMNPERVAAAYAALPSAPRPRLWIATLAAALAATGVLVVAAVTWWPRTTSRHYERPLPPPAAGAFRDGGQPLADPAIAGLLARDLMTFVIEVDADRRAGAPSPGRTAHGAALAAPPAVIAHGTALARTWQAMIAILDRWASDATGGAALTARSTELTTAVRAVSDQLAAAGIGYYLEGNVLTSADTAHALVHSYRVEEVVFVQAGGRPRRVLSLRRIDQLNVTHSLLGMESEDLGDPVLLLDQIDAHVATKTLPVLAPGVPYPLGDAGWSARPEVQQLAAAAGEAIRRELVRVLGHDAEAGGAVATLLAERDTIVERWRDDLERRNLRLAAGDGLFLPDGLIEQLDGVVPATQRRRVTAIEDELARLGAPRIASRLHQLVASSVRRHEAQHGLDEDPASRPPYPAQLAAEVGPAEDADGQPRRHAGQARAELSAYTSQIANDPATPQLAYWHVASFAFDRRAWGSAESYAGVLITEGVAHRLGLAVDGPVIHDRAIDRSRLAVLAAAIAAQSDDVLRDAVRATWQDLYGRPLTPIVDLPPPVPPASRP